MRLRELAFLGLAVSCLAHRAHGADPMPIWDRDGASILNLSSVRESGMGGGTLVGGGQIDVATSAPAALTGLAGSQAILGHEFGVGNTWTDMVGYGLPLGARSFFGGNFRVLTSRGFSETDDRGVEVRRWNNNEFLLAANYAWKAQTRISAGVTGKLLVAELFGTRWTGMTFDAGVQAVLGKDAYAGISLADGGWVAAAGAARTPRAPDLAMGAGAERNFSSAVSVHARAELRRALDGVPRSQLSLGGEVTAWRSVTFRFGWRPGASSRVLAAGLGVAVGAVTLDYSIQPLGDVGSLHRLSLTANLSPADARSRAIL